MYEQLCISGGGIKGFQILGSLCYIEEHFDISKIKVLIGTSVGAIIIYLISIGYKPLEILTLSAKYKGWNNIGRVPDFLKFTNEGGAFSYSSIREFIEKLTIEKIGKFPTMSSLEKEFGKKLIVTTYNVTKKKIEYLSAENNPDLPCIVALQMTSNIPFIFPPFKYNRNLYIDGGVLSNLPSEMIDDKLKTIIICIEPTNAKQDVNNFIMFDYILDILQITSNEIMNNQIKNTEALSSPTQTFIKLKPKVIPFFDFSVDVSVKIDLFAEGYTETKSILKLCP